MQSSIFLLHQLCAQVATPGRLLDHLQNGHQLAPMFQDLRMLVLDEADRLLDMGFRWGSGLLPCALYPTKEVHAPGYINSSSISCRCAGLMTCFGHGISLGFSACPLARLVRGPF